MRTLLYKAIISALLLGLLPAMGANWEDTAPPIGKIELQRGNEIKEGLITIINPKEGVTSFHIAEGAEKGTLKLGTEVRNIKYIKQLRTQPPTEKLQELYSDICLIGWDAPLALSKTTFPLTANRHPEADEIIYIPKMEKEKIIWEKRHIVGLEGFAIWTNLPKRIYSLILFLNGRPSNTGRAFKEGDSGGGWVSENGELLAVTSRVVNREFGPYTQVVYGTLINPSPAPKKSGEKSTPAVIPLTISLCIIGCTTTFLIIKRWGLPKSKK